MILDNLIKNSDWDEVRNEFLNEYPDCFTSINSFEQVYHELKRLKGVQNEIKIRVQRNIENNKDKNEFVSVSGIKEKHEFGNTYNISLIKWQEWLGMELMNETMDNFSSSQIIAHCLYEMTWFGFNQEDINEEFEKMK